jgi:hypothetical protein
MFVPQTDLACPHSRRHRFLLTKYQSGSSIKSVKSDISRYLSKIGRRGGLKGGVSRMASLTPAERKDLARKAATARWSKRDRKRKQS